MKPGLDFYYWRAISATFIARPAKEAVEELNKIATLPIQDFADVISVFVRHGDKVRVSDSTFLSTQNNNIC